MKDLYDILNIDQNSTKTDIKKSYKKLAMLYHPDRSTGDSTKFKEISEAYTILYDDNKKKEYDLYGYDYVTNNISQSTVNPMDIFNSLFGGINSNSPLDSVFSMINPFKTQMKDKIQHVYISLDDIYLGTKKKIHVSRNIKCSHCNSNGYKSNGKQVCPSCNGNKHISISNECSPGFMQHIISPCHVCNSKGFIIKKGYECNKCKQSGIVKTTDIYNITIKKGSIDKDIVLNNKGDYNKNTHSYTKLIIKILEQKHNSFERKDMDLYTTQDIHLYDSLCGCVYPLLFLNNQTIQLNIDKMIKPDSIIRLKGYGLPVYNENKKIYNYGDLLINFNILFPDIFTDNELHKLTQKRNKEKVSISDTISIDYY